MFLLFISGLIEDLYILLFISGLIEDLDIFIIYFRVD